MGKRFIAVLSVFGALAVTAGVSHDVSAYTSSNWTSGYCTGGGGAGGTQNYSIAAKQASATLTYNNTGGACYVGAIAYCQRSSGDVNGYRSSGNNVSQGVTTYDCDNNSTWNFALTNNSVSTRTSDFSSGCFLSC